MVSRERHRSQLTPQPEYTSLNEEDKLNEQDLNDVFNESESFSAPQLATKPVRNILSKLDSQELITQCCNPHCSKKLIFNRRKCYLCGRSFCYECTSHSRELGGTLRQTCAPCFADLHVRQQPGHLRDLKGFFYMNRRTVPIQTPVSNGYHKAQPVNRRRNLNIQVSKEMERLCTGFSKSTSSRFKSSSVNGWVLLRCQSGSKECSGSQDMKSPPVTLVEKSSRSSQSNNTVVSADECSVQTVPHLFSCCIRTL